MTATYRLIGDVHGKFGPYRAILKNSPHRTIQVGDMGVGFRRWPHGEPSVNPPYDAMVAGGHRFIRGNHDNPSVCARYSQCIKDGTVEDGMMLIGGALSIDRHLRYEDFSWWPDEELSPERLNGLVHEVAIMKPEVMVTHECPEPIAAMIVSRLPDLRGGKIKMDPRFASRTRDAFAEMHAVHKPKLWVFGHWHVQFDHVIDGTRFVCLPELAFMDITI